MGILLTFPARVPAPAGFPQGEIFGVRVTGEHLEQFGYPHGTVLRVEPCKDFMPHELICFYDGGYRVGLPAERPQAARVCGKVIAVIAYPARDSHAQRGG
jgi:hypothetical protein